LQKLSKDIFTTVSAATKDEPTEAAEAAKATSAFVTTEILSIQANLVRGNYGKILQTIDLPANMKANIENMFQTIGVVVLQEGNKFAVGALLPLGKTDDPAGTEGEGWGGRARARLRIRFLDISPQGIC